MNARILPTVLLCFVLMTGCIGQEPVENQIDTTYTVESESRIYQHNFTEVMGSEMMMKDVWFLNNTTSAVSEIQFGYQKSPFSDGWVNITLTQNDTIIFHTNETEMGGKDFTNITCDPLFTNWTLIIHAHGSDHTHDDMWNFHDRFYLNMTTTYTNETM
jgi:hypothetical protein